LQFHECHVISHQVIRNPIPVEVCVMYVAWSVEDILRWQVEVSWSFSPWVISSVVPAIPLLTFFFAASLIPCGYLVVQVVAVVVARPMSLVIVSAWSVMLGLSCPFVVLLMSTHFYSCRHLLGLQV
jgi:hypothetical protein